MILDGAVRPHWERVLLAGHILHGQVYKSEAYLAHLQQIWGNGKYYATVHF